MAKVLKSYRKQLLAKFKTKNEKALVVVGRQAVGFVKTATTVDSGFLRSSITFATSTTQSKPTKEVGEKGKNKGVSITAPLSVVPENPSEGHVVVGTNVKYAPDVEYGTVKKEAIIFKTWDI